MTKKRSSNKKEICSTCSNMLSHDYDTYYWKDKVYCEEHYDEAVAEDEGKNQVWEMLIKQ